MRCIACCWKSRLTPACSVVFEGAAVSCRVALYLLLSRPNARQACRFFHTAKHLRIVSYRIAIFCLISYRIYRVLLWLYRAITRNQSTQMNQKQTVCLSAKWVHHHILLSTMLHATGITVKSVIKIKYKKPTDVFSVQLCEKQMATVLSRPRCRPADSLQVVELVSEWKWRVTVQRLADQERQLVCILARCWHTDGTLSQQQYHHQSTSRCRSAWMKEWMWFKWRCHRNCCRDTVQKLSSKMALSVSEEMTQQTDDSLDADKRKPATM